jgi:hypothetical protein
MSITIIYTYKLAQLLITKLKSFNKEMLKTASSFIILGIKE